MQLFRADNSLVGTETFSILLAGVNDGVRPAGLVPGTNYFWASADGQTLTADDPGNGVYNFQSANFVDLSPGTYHFAYASTSGLSQVWAPAGPAISQGTFTLTGSGGVIVPPPAGSPTNIDSSQSSFLSSNLNSTVNPVFQGGTLLIDQVAPTYTSAFTVDNSSTNTIDMNGNTSTFAGVFADADASQPGAITFTGTGGGALTLTGANTYTGGTTINGGMLVLADAGTLGAATGTTTVNGGALDLGGTTQLQSSFVQNGGSIGDGSIIVGTYAVNGGTLNADGIVNAAGGFNVAAGEIDGILTGNGALNKIGDGTVVLAGSNTYTGGTTVDGGMLALTALGTLGAGAGTTTVNDGTLDLGGTTQIQTTLNQAGGTVSNGTTNVDTYGLTGGTLGVNANVNAVTAFDLAAGEVDGTLTGTGVINKTGDGTVVLTGTNSYTGGTVVDGGLLAVSGSGTLGVTTGTITINGGMLDLGGTTQTQTALNQAGGIVSNGKTNVDTYGLTGGTLGINGTIDAATAFNAAAGEVDGTLTGTGALNKTGDGTVVLAGNNSYTGGTAVSGGNVALLGSVSSDVVVMNDGSISGGGNIAADLLVQAGGTLAGGTGGSLAANNVTLQDGAIIQASLGNANPGQPFIVRNNLVLDGTLNVSAAPGFGAGVYHIFTYGGGLTDNGLDLGTTPGSVSNYQLQTVIPGQVNLVNATDTTLNFWDGSQPSKYNDGNIAGGSGTWSLTGQSWTDADGLANTTMRPLPGFAIFQAPGGTVTVDNGNGQVGAIGMQFASDGYAMTGDALELSAPQTVIRVGDGSGEGATYVATIASSLVGAGNLDKTDLGTLILSGPNSYTGGTTVDGGTLAVSGPGTLGITTGTTTVNGGTLDLGGTTQIQMTLNQAGGIVTNGTINVDSYGLTGGTLSVNGTVNAATAFAVAAGEVDGILTGTGALNKTGDGTVVLTGINSYTGGSLVDGGTLAISGAGTLGVATGTTTVNSGLLDFGGTIQTQAVLNQSGGIVDAGTINVDIYGLTGGSLAADGTVDAATAFNISAGEVDGTLAGTGALIKSDDGTVVLAGFNSYTGGTTVGNGTLAVAGIGTLGDAVGTTTVNAGTLALGGTTQTQSALNQAGGIVTGGTIDVGTYGLTGGTLAADATVNAATAFNVTTGQVDGALTGTGTLAKLGDGTVILAGSNSYTGGTNIGSGTLAVAGIGTLGNAAGTTTVDGGTLDLGGTIQSQSLLAQNGGIVANGTINVDTYALIGGTLAVDGIVDAAIAFNVSAGRVDGTLTGSGTLNQVGTGTTVLAGINGYTGGTTINGGALAISGLGTLGAASGSTTVNGGTLDLGGTTQTQTALNQAGGIVSDGTINVGTYGLAGGTLAVNAVVNATTGFNLAAGEVDGTLVGSGALTKTGSGTVILANSNTYTGGTTVAGGVLALGNGGETGSIVGDVTNNGVVAITRSNQLTLDGVISGTGMVAQLGTGSTIFTGTNTYTGGTTISDGTLVLGTGGTTGTIVGDVANNGTLVIDHSDAVTIGGVISGTGMVEQTGSGSTTLAGVNSYSGGTRISGGTLTGSVGSFGSGSIVDNAAMVIDQPTNATFANAINGTGRLTKIGAGTVNLTGNSALSGPTTIAAGGVAVNASFAQSGFDVQSGATISGAGSVGDLIVRTGATLAPGNGGIGSLTVNGNLVQQAGSVFQVQVLTDGAANGVVASGSAQIANGALLNVTRFGGPARTLTDHYTILTAAQGVTGIYTLSGNTQISTFFNIVARYDPTHVFLDAVQTRQFVDAGQTRNQIAVAGGLQSLKVGNRLFGAIGLLETDQDVRAAFDGLSGEVHASAQSAAIEDSRFVREATMLRLREASNGIVGGSTGSDRSDPINATGLSVWGHGFGSWGRLEGDRQANASDLKRSIGGLFVGVDGALTEDFRVGAIGGYSRSTFKVGGRASNITTDSYQAGAYGSGKFGPVGVRFGAAYGWHKLDTDRAVAFTGFSDSLHADYKAHAAQAFGELAYRLDLNGGAFEPFADVAYVKLHTNRFTETGGAAALSGRSANADVTFSTLGLRIIKDIDFGSKTNLYTSMGWRRAFGDRTSSTTTSFASGSDAFSVTGVPIARDAAVLEAGIDTIIANGLTLGASYSGQLSSTRNDHGFKAVVGWKF